jgi:hypothetical protein
MHFEAVDVLSSFSIWQDSIDILNGTSSSSVEKYLDKEVQCFYDN